MSRLLLLFLALWCAAPAGFGQDPMFSQFYSAPLQLNAAFAGTSFAPRIALNYRNQWPLHSAPANAYVTYAASYDQAIERLNSGFGLMLLSDAAGDGILKTNQAVLAYSYRVRINREVGLKFGIDAGLSQVALDWDRLVFLDQIDPLNGPVDPAGNPYPTQEVRPEALTKTWFDVGAGLLLYAPQFYVGLSAKHLTTPDQSFLGLNDNLQAGLPLRLSLHAGTELGFKTGNKRGWEAFVSPNVLLLRQGEFTQVNAGAYLGYGPVFAGTWYRHTLTNADAVIALVGFQKGVVKVGYSFDITVSELTLPGSGGAHELSVLFSFDKSEALQARHRASRYNDCFNMFR